MSPEFREEILCQLRRPGAKADMLIERYLGNPNGEQGCMPYTRDVQAALRLLPPGLHFICGRFSEGTLFWCDLGMCPQVQAWGETLACAISGAAFAYRTHPNLVAARPDAVTKASGGR